MSSKMFIVICDTNMKIANCKYSSGYLQGSLNLLLIFYKNILEPADLVRKASN